MQMNSTNDIKNPVLVTGGAGYIGAHACKALQGQGTPRLHMTIWYMATRRPSNGVHWKRVIYPIARDWRP